MRQEAEVALASDGIALALLKKEFPDLKTFELPAWNIRYNGKSMSLALIRQSAKILKAIIREHEVVKKLVKTERFDAIISDNRFGCYSRKAGNIIITHQVNLIAPEPLLTKPANVANHFWLSKFDEIWVPDFEHSPNLAGSLSHGHNFKNVTYLGALSRMKKMAVAKKYDVVVVLSGPEPRRTELEHKILEQAPGIPKKFLIIRGLPNQEEYSSPAPNIEMRSFLTSEQLNNAILSGEVLVSRSGYSTVMDLFELGHPAILIPTPGQSEQEYLAKNLHEQGFFFTQNQDDFDLATALKRYRQFTGFSKAAFEEADLKEVVRKLVGRRS